MIRGSALLSPGRIDGLDRRHHMVVTAIGVNPVEADRTCGDRFLAHHETQARGGGGLVVQGHAVVGLSRAAAIKHARQGVRVNAICPGVIDTAMTAAAAAAADPALKAAMEAMTPMGRWGQPREIAEAVVWLCSHKASFVIGHAMVVDGGAVAD